VLHGTKRQLRVRLEVQHPVLGATVVETSQHATQLFLSDPPYIRHLQTVPPDGIDPQHDFVTLGGIGVGVRGGRQPDGGIDRWYDEHEDHEHHEHHVHHRRHVDLGARLHRWTPGEGRLHATTSI